MCRNRLNTARAAAKRNKAYVVFVVDAFVDYNNFPVWIATCAESPES
jgi:hypothetical protein